MKFKVATYYLCVDVITIDVQIEDVKSYEDAIIQAVKKAEETFRPSKHKLKVTNRFGQSVVHDPIEDVYYDVDSSNEQYVVKPSVPQ